MILTFEDVSALQLLHSWSLTQSPAEKHQNHVLDHFHSISKVSVTVSDQQRAPVSVSGDPAIRACYRRTLRPISRLNIAEDHHI